MRSGSEDEDEQSPGLLPGTVEAEGVRKRAAASSTGKKDLQLEDAEEEKPLVGGPPLSAAAEKKTKSRSKSAKKLELADNEWDVFLSYRVSSDQKLVQDIYWRLVAQDVVVGGKTRKMKPFWDAECLKPGESWEEGFKNAIIRTTLIVPVFSRKAFANIPELTPDSACDNVILEYELALAMVISFCTLSNTPDQQSLSWHDHACICCHIVVLYLAPTSLCLSLTSGCQCQSCYYRPSHRLGFYLQTGVNCDRTEQRARPFSRYLWGIRCVRECMCVCVQE
jgi:hypothetical protein